MAPFIIFGLPRSRTYWLSRFLTYSGWHCGHDELRHVRSIDDIKTWLGQPNTGTAETAAAPFWRTLHNLAPDARVVVVRRRPADVVRSLFNLPGLDFDLAKLAREVKKLNRKLDQIEKRLPNVLSVQFADLGREETCARIFEHCLPFKHDPAWWAKIAPLNLQIDMLALTRYFQAYRPQLEKVAAMVRQQTLTDMMLRPAIAPDGVTFQIEPLARAYPDAAALIHEHLVEVGESPEGEGHKNVPLLMEMDQRGLLQVMTARSNGRMFGYLVTVLGPSLEHETKMSAVHTTFFASPLVPGLGMKLQRASLAALRERGMSEVFFRAGTRGSGPRMGTLYRRLGATPSGELYRLELGDQ